MPQQSNFRSILPTDRFPNLEINNTFTLEKCQMTFSSFSLSSTLFSRIFDFRTSSFVGAWRCIQDFVTLCNSGVYIIDQIRDALSLPYALENWQLFRHVTCDFFIRMTQVRGLHVSAVQNSEARLKTFSIYRWNPDKPQEKPYTQDYKVDLNS